MSTTDEVRKLAEEVQAKHAEARAALNGPNSTLHYEHAMYYYHIAADKLAAAVLAELPSTEGG